MFLPALKPILLSVLLPLQPQSAEQPCQRVKYDAASYTICRFDRNDPGLALFLRKADGAPFGEFSALEDTLRADGKTLLFAMNAGMYHEDRSPVGLYIERGEQIAPIQTGAGYGNFHLLPNGVFYLDEEGAHVLASKAYLARRPTPVFATQSGPMLVIDGALHPAFNKDSTSYKRRNGVGIDADTGTVYFVISDGLVTFYRFASLFRDHLNTQNALYLDGSISRLYAPGMGRDDFGAEMGPIIAVTRPLEQQEETE